MKAKVRAPAPVRVVWDGQSHNLWPPANIYDGRGPIPNRVMFGLGVPWVNVAVGDTGWASLSGTGGPSLTTSAPTRLFPHARKRAGCKDVLIMLGGEADIYVDGRTGAQAYDRAVTYANTAKAAGFTHVLAVTSPQFDFNKDGGFDAATVAYDAALVADTSLAFNAVFDISGPPFDESSNSTYFESDWTHLNALGAQTAANIIRPALVTFLAGL